MYKKIEFQIQVFFNRYIRWGKMMKKHGESESLECNEMYEGESYAINGSGFTASRTKETLLAIFLSCLYSFEKSAYFI